MRLFCDAEVAAQERANLTLSQRERLEFYMGFNRSMLSRIDVGMSVIRGHLAPASRPNVNGYEADDSPVSACILKTLADGNTEREVAPLAQEGYALRLLTGAGVTADRTAAKEYLQQAAERWKYGSAAVRLARLHLEGSPKTQDVEKAERFAWLALESVATTPGGSVAPEEAIPILFDIYLSGKFAPRDTKAATALYTSLLRKRGLDAYLMAIGKKEPSILKAAQAELAAEALEKEFAADRRCTARKQRYDDCRIGVGSGYGRTLRVCGSAPSC